MARSRAAAAVLCILGLGACGGGGGGGSASVPSVVKLTNLASSQKIDSLTLATTTTVPGSAGAAATTVSGTAALQLRPTLAGDLHFTVAGRAISERIIGNAIYVELPQIAAHDGGRPWVSVDLGAASSAAGINLSELLAQARNADPTSTLRLLAAKHVFHSIGTSTVDGQRVTGLTGSFTPSTLTSSVLSPDLVAQVKAKLTQLGATREEVTTYLTDAGHPVRIVTTLTTTTHGPITSTVDIRDINVPVSVAPPPAGQTITLAEVKKLGG
jgi:hypothetical protein